MAKKDSELDALEYQVRELKSRNRQLKRRIKELNRDLQTKSTPDEAIPEEAPKLDAAKKCPKCYGEVKFIHIVNRIIERCDDCGWRGKTKRAEKATK